MDRVDYTKVSHNTNVCFEYVAFLNAGTAAVVPVSPIRPGASPLLIT